MSIYKPTIKNYKPFYLQPDGDSLAIDTLDQWGLVAKTNPYYALPEAKELYSNDWHDEDGLDEFNKEIRYKSTDIEVSFYLRANASSRDAAIAELNAQMDAFFSKIRTGEMKIYDSYTQIGRQKVRYKSFKEDSFRAGDNWARLIFSIIFQVNDPITKVIYRNYSLETV